MKILVPLDWQSADGRYRVKIDRRCVRRIVQLAIEHYPNEVGTSLVGYYSTDGLIAYITSIAPLPPDSWMGRFTFIRGVIGLSEFFQRISRRFKGHRYRVGEWHSHPYAVPCPSGTDNMNQTALANDKKEGLQEAILVILGGDAAIKPSLGVFVYSRKRGRIDLQSR